MKTNKPQTLLLRSFDEDLNDKEQNLLDALLKSSEDAKSDHAEFSALREAVTTLPKTRFSAGFSERVMASATQTEDAPKTIARIYSINSGRLLRVAAMILLLVGISTVVWLQPRIYTAPYGQQVSRLLPDGSTVLLSGGATLSYKPFWGRADRKVHLAGEAFFDVTKSSKSFIVETFNSEVRVLGTRFNVKAWPDQQANYTSVVLEEGLVDVVSLTKPDNAYRLLPSESIVIAADTTFPKKSLTLPIEAKLAWRTGGLTFENEYLTDVVAELSRRYNMRLSLAGNLGQRKITYYQPNQESVDTVLDAISGPHALAYRKTANGYELFAP
ncbi:MAG: FecR family protein [Rhodothermales bacterium]